MTPQQKRDAAVDAFAAAMKARLDWAAANGRAGWDDEKIYSSDRCRSDLAEDATDMDINGEWAKDLQAIDIAARCMFLWYRAEKPVLSPPAPSEREGREPASSLSPFFIRVRDAHGTYTARCQGKVASCTGSERGAAEAVAAKVMAGKGPFSVKGSGSSWRIIPEAGL